MTAYSTTVRATHLLTNAAWFGGSLLGAVPLNPAARQGDDFHERGEIADAGWHRSGPGQRAEMGLHLLSGVAMLADNRRRLPLAHSPTQSAVVAKTGLTGVAVTAGAAAFRSGAKLGDTRKNAQADATAGQKTRFSAARMKWLQQRGLTGRLDRPSNPLPRS